MKLLTEDEALNLNNISPGMQIARAGEAIRQGQKLTTIEGTFDFDIDTGAQQTVQLKDAKGALVVLPENIIIQKILSDEITTLTSAGSATLQVKAGSTVLTGLVAFAAGFTGIDDQALASSADGIKLTSEQDLNLTIATADLTAGKATFHIEFIQIG